MSEVIIADPDEQVSAMCHRNHVDRAYLYEQSENIPDAKREPVHEQPKCGPVIHIVEEPEMEIPMPHSEPRNDKGKKKIPTIWQVKRVLGAMGRWGAGILFLCGVADGLIDTTYGLMLTIICAVWGLLHLIQGVAHG